MLNYLDCLFSFGYYLTFFVVPLIGYFLLCQIVSQKKSVDFFYFIKLYFAKIHVSRIQKKFEIHKPFTNGKDEIPTNTETDSVVICGADQKGDNFALRILSQPDQIAYIDIYLKISQINAIYTFPGNSTKLYRINKNPWKFKDLSVEILEPFRRLRVKFNGFLQKNGNEVEYVHFSFIWSAAGGPTFYPSQSSGVLLADALAHAPWKDGNWRELLDNERGYDQFGALHGYVKGGSIADELVLNLPSCRSRHLSATKQIDPLDKSLQFFIAGQNGTLTNIVLKSFTETNLKLKYGNVISNSGQVQTVCDVDAVLDQIVPNDNIQRSFKLVWKTETREFYCILNTEKSKFDAQNDCDSQLRIATALCELNLQFASCVVIFSCGNLGDKNFGRPPPLGTFPKEFVSQSQRLVEHLNSDHCKNVALAGGKGTSLAFLSSITSNDFSVPTGFTVTVDAFQAQLESKFNLRKAVLILEDICCGRTKGNLENACTETINAFKNEKICKEIVDAVTLEWRNICEKGDSWAVRSSGVDEDLDEISAAGQNATILGVKTLEEVLLAIVDCWASLFTHHSVQYRRQHGLEIFTKMAVVVQKMVPSDCAGVLFTCNPSNGHPGQMVFTSNFGLGESVVSGRSDPDTIILGRNWKNDVTILSKTKGKKQMAIKVMDESVKEVVEELNDDWSVSEEQALKLGKVGVLLEDYFDSPQDVEWAFHQGHLYLVQSRPITTLNCWSDFELLHEFDDAVLTDDSLYTVANTGEVFPGATSVLTLTTVISSLDQGMQQHIWGRVDGHVHKCVQTFQHHIFMDVINAIHKNPRDELHITSKILDLAVFGHAIIDEKINSIAIERFGITTRWQLLRESFKMLHAAWRNGEYLKQIEEKSKRLKIIIADRDTILEIHSKIDQFLVGLKEIFQLHGIVSGTSVFYQILTLNVLAESNTDFNMDHYNDMALLLSSCGDVISAQVPAILERISAILASNKQIETFSTIQSDKGFEWLQENNREAYEILRTFMNQYGHRSLGEFDLMKVPWGRNPAQIIEMIQAICGSGKKPAKTTQSIDEVVQNLVSPTRKSTRIILKYLMSKCRKTVGSRETSKSALIWSINELRNGYALLAEKMVEAGLIPSKDLVFHLAHRELKRIILKRSPDLINKAMRRKRLYPIWNRSMYPELSFGYPSVEDRKKDTQRGDAGKVVQGTPVCKGNVEARACVIVSLDEISQLLSGDVLITYSTDIGWSPYFPMLSGIVTELGGLVSHGAVVAREYGLPCIVGVSEATKIFKTGDRVRLRGETGTIELN